MTQTRVISVNTLYKHKAFFEAFFDGIAMTITAFEAVISDRIDPEKNDKWVIEAYFSEDIAYNDIYTEITKYAKDNELYIEEIKLSLIENIDFASKVLEDFKPINIAKFYIYNSVHKDNLPKDLIPMEISAGLAFGTGDHETTSGCIELLCALDITPSRILDMGTGSGVLSIAAAKLFNASILAVDIEENSIITAKQNLSINHITDVMVERCDGYEAKVYAHGPYDLILSNILARPLIEMSASLAENLSANGVAILAGFLEDQSHAVIDAHIKKGLKLDKIIKKNNWIIAQLSKLTNS